MFEGGEYIINKRATSKIGVDRLNQLNSMGSGGALPEFEFGTTYGMPKNLTGGSNYSSGGSLVVLY